MSRDEYLLLAGTDIEVVEMVAVVNERADIAALAVLKDMSEGGEP